MDSPDGSMDSPDGSMDGHALGNISCGKFATTVSYWGEGVGLGLASATPPMGSHPRPRAFSESSVPGALGGRAGGDHDHHHHHWVALRRSPP